MSCVWMLQRGHSGDGCVLASTLCKYDLRKGDLFVLSWARVRRVKRGSLSSEQLMCGGSYRNRITHLNIRKHITYITVTIFVRHLKTLWEVNAKTRELAFPG